MKPTLFLLNGGGERIRTDDPLLAKQVLYQLSYTPVPMEKIKRSLGITELVWNGNPEMA